MSKKLNSSVGGASPKNTLLMYFSKSPALDKKRIAHAPPDTAIKKETDKENLENGKDVAKDVAKDVVKADKPMDVDDEDVVVGTQLKRRRRILVSDDSDEEHDARRTKSHAKPRAKQRKRVADSDDDSDDGDGDGNGDGDGDGDDDDDDFQPSDEAEEAKAVASEDDSPRRSNNNNEPRSKKPKLDTAAQGGFLQKLEKLQATAAKDGSKSAPRTDDKYEKIVCSGSTLDEPVVWPHQKLEFLRPEHIKDKGGRRPDHPDYDPSTLHVPASFLANLSPGVRQWWVLKSTSFDCVLFFKVGKFYELYHMDADVGVRELGFTYMRGEFAHSGFPEISFDKMASILVDRGYKVARVEQTETPDMMTERCKAIKATKFDKVVRREICQITNRGTQVFGSQCKITPNHKPNYMLAVVERSTSAGAVSKYGVCYIDTSIGDFYVGEFEDDKNCSRLLTLLSHHMPVLVLAEKSSLSDRTHQIFRTILGGTLKEFLPAGACSAEKALKHLAEQYYAKSEADNWPLVLRTMQAESDHLGLTPHDSFKLALKALGECIAYLAKCHLEEKVLPMARFHFYTPPDMADVDAAGWKAALSAPAQQRRAHMVLDATTLSNLHITGEEHSLVATLDNCCTKFGKRLLHHWVCAPTCDIAVIGERQRAIAELLERADVLQEVRALLAPMADYERHLAQIHLFGNKQVMADHPDGRAIFFEEKQYNKKKIQNFIGILKGFEALMCIPAMFSGCSCDLLKRITQLPAQGGVFPEMHEHIDFFKNAFDHEEAAKSGVIAPERGVDADYDDIEAKIAEISAELKAYLVEQEKFFGCRLCYFGSDKKRFQLEVPEGSARKAGKAYQLEGQRKGAKPCRRFSTNETRNFLKRMQNAEEQRNSVLRDLARRIFEKFSRHYAVWKQCVDCVAHLDVLASLAEYARNQNVVCVPEFVATPADGQPFIEVADGYHPCVNADTYIPNGIALGVPGTAPLSILTGPNMGGKSTLMRQVGLLVIMAQIGAHVPAQQLKLSIVDRIFTRLGAQDDILSGHSTFLVELNETSLILKHATRSSLVLLDELGRGTATYDGTAIAASVVNFLADLKCRTLFSTHYHNLIDFFHKDDRITLGHMACMVENEMGTEDPTQETVTFLYKYTAGACPKSYGFNAAKLAGMPHPIIKRAYELSKRVEAIALQRKITAKIVAAAGGIPDGGKLGPIRNLLVQLKMCQI